MDAEPCYPLFSAALESAEALASSHQKYQTLNLADYKVMRQLLPMTLVCHVTCLGSMVLNPDRMPDRCTPIVPNFKAPVLPKRWGSNNFDRTSKIPNFFNISKTSLTDSRHEIMN